MIRPLALAATLAAALGASAAAAQADLKRGEKLFEECVACHMLERDVEGVGPSLYGMFGRKAGGSDSFRAAIEGAYDAPSSPDIMETGMDVN